VPDITRQEAMFYKYSGNRHSGHAIRELLYWRIELNQVAATCTGINPGIRKAKG